MMYLSKSHFLSIHRTHQLTVGRMLHCFNPTRWNMEDDFNFLENGRHVNGRRPQKWNKNIKKMQLHKNKSCYSCIFNQQHSTGTSRQPDRTIAHKFDFLNWRTCPPVSEDKSTLSSNLRTNQFCPLVLEDRAKQHIKKLILQLIQHHKLAFPYFS